MKRIAIVLRKSGNINRFRRVILGSLKTSAIDEALLCSGFFQDDTKYSAGTEFDLIPHRMCSPLSLTVLGLYSYSWKTHYTTFISQIRLANPCPCVAVIPKRVPGMRWHAKVFVAKSAGQPVVSVIGSSNVTRRAFGEFKEFNYECDVILWDERHLAIDSMVNNALGDPEDVIDVIVANYDETHKFNTRTLPDRLLGLEREIMTIAVDP